MQRFLALNARQVRQRQIAARCTNSAPPQPRFLEEQSPKRKADSAPPHQHVSQHQSPKKEVAKSASPTQRAPLTNGVKRKRPLEEDVGARRAASSPPTSSVKQPAPSARQIAPSTFFTSKSASTTTKPVTNGVIKTVLKPAPKPISDPAVKLKQAPQPKAPKPVATGTRISKSWPEKVGRPNVRGMNNPGNYCYRRSLLQSLFSAPQFFNLLDASHPNCDHRCVTCALRQLVRSYHTSSASIGKEVNQLDQAIKATGKKSDPRWISNVRQEDAHEFLQYLLGTMEAAKGIGKDTFSTLFKLAHRTSWVCVNCKKVHTRVDQPNLGISLPIPKGTAPVRLESCLDAYHKESGLQIRCDDCRSNTKRTRNLSIAAAPEILFVQLMRFAFDGRSARKNRRKIVYPERLDLARWGCAAPNRYRLQAVVAQSGSLHAGHYVAYVRAGGNLSFISDHEVKAKNAGILLDPKEYDPYILMYVRE